MLRTALLLLLLPLALPLSAGQRPLADHPSPYLTMHADDPVHWQLWDKRVLKRAKREKRLIFVSSGYFACHWCHVMQRESFRNTDIAELLNRYFIPVKIDRELWPELDAMLIDFVEKTRGAAGWPLNVFLSPDGHPIVGTTYLPPDRFADYLQRLQQRWVQAPDSLSSLAAAASAVSPMTPSTTAPALSPQVLEERLRMAFLGAWRERADLLAGGFDNAAKFPQAPLLSSLLMLKDEPEIRDFLTLTLKQMAANGLRDHLGGGFFRYTIDPAWQSPHFEKMLYDNAQLAALYLEAAEVLEDEAYRRVGLETIDFMLREMRHPGGGFISALSAVDGDGVEGGHYLWRDEDLEAALGGEAAALAKRYWGMHGAMHWDRGYLPVPRLEMPMDGKEKLKAIKEQLRLQRQKRNLPRDNKRLAAGNALMLIALSAVYRENGRYVTAGSTVRDYLHQLWDGKQLWRLLDDGGKRWLPAGIEDYAVTALALLRWADVADDERSRRLAARLVATSWQRFYGEAGWLPGGETTLIGHRLRLLPEGALPSPAAALLEANRLLGEKAPISRQAMLKALTRESAALLDMPMEHSGYLILLQRLNGG